MKFKRKWLTSTAIALVLLFVGSIVFMPFTSSTVYAEQVPLTFTTDSWQAEGQFSKYSMLTTNTLLAKEGYKIKDAVIKKNNTVFRTLTGAVGQTEYTVSESLPGEKVDIFSKNNQSTEGYYAWYRYAKAGGDYNWHADFERLDTSYNSYGEHRTCQSGTLDEFGMPEAPGCLDSQLAMMGALINDFKTTSGTVVNKVAVDRIQATGSATIMAGRSIQGPEGIVGLVDDGNLSSHTVELSPDIDIVVRFTQDFTYPSPYYKNLAAYGAKLMVYFSAFTVDVQAATYQYPYTLDVTYELIPTAQPDLIAVNVTAQTPLTVNTPVTFELEWNSNGPQATDPFVIEVNYLGTPLYQKTIHPGDYSSGVPKKDTFQHTFTTAGSKTLSLSMDMGNGIEEASELNNDISRSFTIVADPGITGDFDILPSTINYRDSFKLVPKNIVEKAGCTYSSHIFRLDSGTIWDSPQQNGKTVELSFSYPSNYPAPIKAGTVNVQMKIYSSCGSTSWISKTLTVNSPTDNENPYFKVGWFQEGDTISKTPVTQVVQGTKLMARMIDDPNSIPYPSPSDPDGDPISFTGWDFNRSSNFVKGLPGKYGFNPLQETLTGITMDTVGYHLLYGTIKDPFGGSYTAMTMVEVIPPNPIPVAVCPPTVKENRPVAASLFNANGSYSPAGRQIDHARDEWTNKLASYTNGTLSDITVQASLHVWDNGSPALKSLQPSTCNIVVKPDLVPVGKLDVPTFGIRNMQVDLYNKSYSPDGDVLVSAAYRYKYDATNDGFGNDGWNGIAGNMTKASFTPNFVGKYLFDVTVCEDYGRCASASVTQVITSLTFDVINLAPSVSFSISGQNQQPDLNPPVSYAASTILYNWSLFSVNSTQLKNNKNAVWSNNGGLVGGLGKGFERQYYYNIDTTWFGNYYHESWAAPFQDNGYGNNNLSPWRAQTSYNSSMNNLDSFPVFEGDTNKVGLTFGDITHPPTLRSNKKYIYVDKIRQYYDSSYGRMVYEGKIFGVNKSEIGNVKSLGGYYTWDFTYNNGNPFDFVIQVNTSTIGTRTFPSMYGYCDGGCLTPTTAPGTPHITGYEISDRTIYATIKWVYVSEAGYYEDGTAYAYESSVDDIATFDAYTGQFIGRASSKGFNPPVASFKTYENGWHITNAVNRNDNMVYFNFGGRQAYEVDRTGTLVRQTALPAAPAYTMGADPDPWDGFAPYYFTKTSNIYKDVNGDIYIYEETMPQYYPTGNNLAVQTHLSKINIDGSLGWRIKLTGTGSSPYACANVRGFSNGADAKSLLLINPVTGKVMARSFTDGPSWTCYSYMQSVDMISGASAVADLALYEWTSAGEKFRFDWSGNVYDEATLGTDLSLYTTTRENYYTRTTESGEAAFSDNVRDAAGTYRGTAGSGGQQGFGSNTTRVVFGQYFGDGIYVTMHHNVNWGNYDDGSFALWFSKGPATTAPEVLNPFELGQFVSDVTVSDTELSFTMKMEDVADTGLAGMSFRMADPRNRYALETDGTTLYLSRYIGGVRTILNSVAYPFQNSLDYSFKVKMAGTQIDVSLNGVPYLSASDGSFLSGKIGPFSEKSYVKFNGVSTKVVQADTTQWLANYAIWESGTASASVRYDNLVFSDPESDPRAGSYQWTYTHTPKFMNNQGVSGSNGQTYTSERLSFDKVGEYLVTLRARDDPQPSYLSPSMTFDSYRKTSNAFQQRLIVHRRPVAQFSIWVNGDGTIGWNDTSYDPDRWVNAGSYSPPDTTGINYGSTKGIMERKYYYTAPSGAYVESKLTRPMETGTYTVGLSVRDEYGAWSFPFTQTITVGSTPPPNTRPTATLTYPNGSQGSPTLIYTYRPTISWNQNDTGGTVFQGFHVKISDETGQLIAESGETPQWTSANSASWNLPVDLPAGTKLQVQVRVNDGEEWSVWSNIGWMKVNSAPTVSLTYPNGQQGSPNLIQDNRRPTLSWNQYDADLSLGTYFQGFHVQVLNDVGTAIYDYSAGQYTQSNAQSMTVTADLPTGQSLQVKVRVHDGAFWSEWSNIGWMLINMTPSANITSPTGTQATPSTGGPQPNIIWTQTDPDPGTEFLKYQVQFWNEANTVAIRDSGVTAQNTTSTTQSYQVTTDLPAGQKLRVRVRVFDGYVWSNWSSDQWILTNRPPVADFTWSPTLIWEGDTV